MKKLKLSIPKALIEMRDDEEIHSFKVKVMKKGGRFKREVDMSVWQFTSSCNGQDERTRIKRPRSMSNSKEKWAPLAIMVAMIGTLVILGLKGFVPEWIRWTLISIQGYSMFYAWRNREWL